MKRTKVMNVGRGALRFALLATAAAFLVLAGCQIGAPAPGVPGFAKGVITAKGSIWVNGIEYDTTSASITVNDTGSHPDSDLKVGMVVSVKGSIDAASGKGTAAEVQFAANLEGPIDAASINVAASSFTVFGQLVVADGTTVYEGVAGFSGLTVGDRVEVSGTADSVSHSIKAARIEKKVSSDDYELKGVVSNVTASSLTLTPEHAAAGITVNFTGTLASGIVNGSFVEVKFPSFASPLTVTADHIKLLEKLQASDKERVEASGVVSSFASGAGASTFTVDGIDVSADNALLSGVSDGVKVEVKGTMQGSVLVAESVKVERESNIGLLGDVTAVDVVGKTLTVNGVKLAVDSKTIFRDEGTATPVASFGLSDVLVGDHVGAAGYTDASASPALGVATRVMRLPALPMTVLAGPVSAKATGSLTILGVAVNTTGAAFKDANEATVTESAFLAAITLDTTLVGAIGTSSGATFTATKAQIGEDGN
jgi:hypothetical protein